jgi:inosine-uridine nucleoside N-ribohydrolase
VSRTNILLSTDIGTDIDDAVAAYLAANSETIDLRGIYVTNGPVETRAKIAARLMRLMGHDALVAVGESHAIYTQCSQYITLMEETSVPGNDKRKSLEDLGIVKDWYSAITKQLNELGEVVVVSIAPLTTLAKLLERTPEVASRIKRLYIMGGRLGEGEFNFSQDSVAAQMVLDSSLDIVVVPAGVCEGYMLGCEELTGLRGSRGQRYLATMSELWKLKHDCRFLKTSSFVRSFLKERHAGYFNGCDMFYNGLEALVKDKSIDTDPFTYLRFYKMFKTILAFTGDNPKVRLLLDYLKGNEQKGFAVHDAYTIYSIEHPDKVQLKSVEISCDKGGVMSLKDGGRHRIVTNVDYRHFARYLKQGLGEKPRRLGRVRT